MQSTADTASPLLRSLSDEELGQYAQLATDQIAREGRWIWLKAAAGLTAVGLLAWTGFETFYLGFDRVRLYSLGLAGVMSYWPYRSLKSWRLWRGHLDAVRDERVRRNGTTEKR